MKHLENWPADITAHELAKDICARLIEYYHFLGTSRQVRFVLPKIDSGSYDYPYAGLFLSYESGDAAFKMRFSRALVEMTGYTDYLTHAEAIKQVLLVIEATRSFDAFPLACAVLAARADLDVQRYPIYATALQIAQRMGQIVHAWEGVNHLVASENFPEKLIFDAFELCVTDNRPDFKWWQWFTSHESTMIGMSAEPRFNAANVQLRRVAHRLSCISLDQIDKGFCVIFGDELPKVSLQRQTPRTPGRVLLDELTKRADSTLEYINDSGKLTLNRRSQTFVRPRPVASRFPLLEPQEI